MPVGVTKVGVSILDENLSVGRREPLLYRAWVATNRRAGINVRTTSGDTYRYCNSIGGGN